MWKRPDKLPDTKFQGVPDKKFQGIPDKKFQAYLMSGNEIAQILFLFFLPITVKV